MSDPVDCCGNKIQTGDVLFYAAGRGFPAPRLAKVTGVGVGLVSVRVIEREMFTGEWKRRSRPVVLRDTALTCRVSGLPWEITEALQ